jgi:hypothetical protein
MEIKENKNTKESRELGRFILRVALALVPLAVFLALYLTLDPFGVVHPYSGVSVHAGDSLEHIPNKRYVAVEGLDHYIGERHYDSFIFGSSLSTNFTAAAWSRHLPADASIYHFTAGAEPLEGIRDEIRYLFDRGVQVRHVLMVMEEEMYRRPKRYSEMPYVPHYKVSPEVSWLDFHRVHFNAYRDPELFLYSLFPSLVADRLVPDGKMQPVPVSGHDELINEDRNDAKDSLILSDPDAYFSEVPWLVEMRALPNPMPSVVTGESEHLLREIADMLREHQVDYQVIVPPRFRTQGLQAVDRAMLYEILGRRHVHDFSNDSVLVHDLHSYYDGMHILIHRCTELIDRSYRESELPLQYPGD